MLCVCGLVMQPIYRNLDSMGLSYLSCAPKSEAYYLDFWWCPDCGATEEDRSTMTKAQVKHERQFSQ